MMICSFADVTKIKRQLITTDGQIRYMVVLEDVPLESPDFCELRDAIQAGARYEITLRRV